ncbi:hypothetical protein M3148_00020 [Georgenia satyanarayanai]|uniref:hypothetical protein n=1 Tax=Georgenia satyanarayanai TaxID=860221 RepID=UPI00203E8C10|nr:hypothetical protein [Georgenia satyanarayanai]MCM3659388.1 hypothetical protein [Georgenia satyanarayanai]
MTSDRRRPNRRRERHLHAVDEPPAPSPDDFLGSITEALDDREPLGFLALASSIVAALDPRSRDPLTPARDDTPDAALLVESLSGHAVPETTALLLALAVLLPDDHLAQRARREARRRRHALPDWLLRLDDAAPGPAAAVRDLLGDGQNTVVSVRLAGGEPLTAIVYVDHNLGTVAKDGFVIPGELDDFRTDFFAIAEEQGAMSFVELDAADARAQLEDAVASGAMTVPRFETDTWPASRPLVEWIAGLLPAGGTGFAHTEWTDEELSQIVVQLMGSEEGAALSGRDDAEIARDLVWFTADYSGGDPLRWSFLNVQRLLTDWYPRKVHAPRTYLRRMPVVLRAMVCYAHRTKEVPSHLTEQTLEAIDASEPVYRKLIAGGTRSAGPFDALEALRIEELLTHTASHDRARAARAVGNEQALDRLDDAPLPDEEFRWEHIAEDVHERVAQVLELMDGCAEAMFDVEMRTAFRRVLARTAQADPVVFRRRSKPGTAAAAIAWAVAAANDRLSPYSGGLTAKALLAHFGVTGSVAQRAQPFLRAFGAEEPQLSGELSFGTPDVLTSARRAQLIALRDGDGYRAFRR